MVDVNRHSAEWRELKTKKGKKIGRFPKREKERKRGLASDLRSLRSKLGACHPLSRPACKPLNFTPFATLLLFSACSLLVDGNGGILGLGEFVSTVLAFGSSTITIILAVVLVVVETSLAGRLAAVAVAGAVVVLAAPAFGVSLW